MEETKIEVRRKDEFLKGSMMKKLMILMLVLMAAPVFALTFNATDLGGGIVEIGYSDANLANYPSGIALKVTVDNGAIIDDVNGFKTDGEYETGDAQVFGIYPSMIDINDAGDINHVGAPISPAIYPGGYDLPGDTVVLELGALYPEGNEPDMTSGTLCNLVIDANGAADTNVSIIDANALRGGVVLRDATTTVDVDVSQTVTLVTDCYTGPDVTEWESVGKPDSWCNQRQCHGDADGIENEYGEPDPFTGEYEKAWVSSEDVQILINGYRQDYSGDPSTDPWIAADFDHTNNEYGEPDPFTGEYEKARVSSEDVAILITYYRADTVPADCLD